MTKEMKKATTKMIDIYSDPAHAWGKVERTELIELGIADKISACSYMSFAFAYLEEDCDLGHYMLAMAVKGIKVELREHHTDRQSKIRSYNPYHY